MAQPDFARALREAEQIALDGQARTLLRLGDKAALALETAMDDAAAPHGIKIKAANVALTHQQRIAESGSLLERVAALEAAIDEEKRT